ncbi:MAG: amino acid ABC transporter permease [Synergistaceae bacterium]|jgi:polar amino acid transport system substrate-binding protein|nr:amino acid ABC transporter permease [Synergistaceae bacterium]
MEFIARYYPFYISGTVATLCIAVITVFFGTIIGVFVSLFRLSRNPLLSAPANLYVQVLRGTPALLQVMIFYFGISRLVHIPSVYIGTVNLARFIPGCAALAINSSAYTAEIVRAGINAVPIGQTEAGYSLGLTKAMTMREIVLPQAVRNILPALGNEFISVIKETSLLSVIAIQDLLFVASNIQASSYLIMEPLYVAAAIYFTLTCCVSAALAYLEKRLARGWR